MVQLEAIGKAVTEGIARNEGAMSSWESFGRNCSKIDSAIQVLDPQQSPIGHREADPDEPVIH